MKHRLFMFSLIFVLVLILFISLFPFGTKNYKINDYKVKVPRMMFAVEKNQNEIKFRTFRDYRILKREVNNILKKYKEYKKDNKTYYYDVKQDLYIEEYKVKKGFFMNEVIIKLEG